MKIKDQIADKDKKSLITLSPQDSIEEALKIMCKNNIGSLVIVDNEDRVVGIITERDMMHRVLYPKIDPKSTKIAQIMTKDILTADQNDEVLDWIHTMSHERFRHLPVVDNQDRLVAILSQGDFIAYTWPDLYEKVKQDIRGRIGPLFQIFMVLFAVITMLLIYMRY